MAKPYRPDNPNDLTNATYVAGLAYHGHNVANAFSNKGINPAYHNRQMRRLQLEWPALYDAVAGLTQHTKTLGGA